MRRIHASHAQEGGYLQGVLPPYHGGYVLPGYVPPSLLPGTPTALLLTAAVCTPSMPGAGLPR